MSKEVELDAEQRELVRRVVVAEREAARKTQAAFGKWVDLSQQTISKIETTKEPVGLQAAIKIAKRYPEQLGMFLILSGTVGGNDAASLKYSKPPASLQAVADNRRLVTFSSRLGLPQELVVLLTDDSRRALVEGIMGDLPEKVVSAAFGVIHVRSVSVETAMKVARELYDELCPDGDIASLDAKFYLDRISERLNDHPFKGSGTYPSPVAKTRARAASQRKR